MKSILTTLLISITLSVVTTPTTAAENQSAEVNASKNSDDELLEEVNRKEMERKEEVKRSEVKQAEEAKQLLKKYGNIGPSPNFLSSQFQTFSGSVASGNIRTIIKFYSCLNGKKKWDKRGEAWVLTQNTVDNITNEKHEFLYAFYDLRATDGYYWLGRIIHNKQEMPKSQFEDIAVDMCN